MGQDIFESRMGKISILSLAADADDGDGQGIEANLHSIVLLKNDHKG